MGNKGFAPTWLRQVSPPLPPDSQNHFNHCYCAIASDCSRL